MNGYRKKFNDMWDINFLDFIVINISARFFISLNIATFEILSIQGIFNIFR